jgi:hypothetical protein
VKRWAKEWKNTFADYSYDFFGKMNIQNPERIQLSDMKEWVNPSIKGEMNETESFKMMNNWPENTWKISHLYPSEKCKSKLHSDSISSQNGYDK